MIGYQTQQRNQLISFFRSNPNEMFTIDEITEHLKAQSGEAAPSRSTIYRTVSSLEAERILQRSYLADLRRSAYQYRDESKCQAHLHLRCETCNTLMHLNDHLSHTIVDLLYGEQKVDLNLNSTVLLGRCEKCAKEQS